MQANIDFLHHLKGTPTVQASKNEWKQESPIVKEKITLSQIKEDKRKRVKGIFDEEWDIR